MQQFGPPFGSIPMQSVMTGSMLPAPPPPTFPGPAPGSLFPGGSGGFGRGLLSRLFGIGGGAGQSMGGAMTSGLASSAGSGMNLTTMLTNAQRIVGLTQQVVPMVQQYGPLIRNMPMIWKIMRSSNNSDEVSNEEITTDDSATTTEENAQPSDSNISEKEANTQLADSRSNEEEHQVRKRKQPSKLETINGIPAPKLYI